jgi:uncharacterized protein (DUF2252 family)
MPRDNAERVVAGARSLSPYLGKRMLAAELMGKSVVLRELLPLILSWKWIALRVTRLSLPRVSLPRQIDETARKSWMSDLQRNRSKNLDAPFWLWTSVVELVASHERAYLEHCREYALASAG